MVVIRPDVGSIAKFQECLLQRAALSDVHQQPTTVESYFCTLWESSSTYMIRA